MSLFRGFHVERPGEHAGVASKTSWWLAKRSRAGWSDARGDGSGPSGGEGERIIHGLPAKRRMSTSSGFSPGSRPVSTELRTAANGGRRLRCRRFRSSAGA